MMKTIMVTYPDFQTLPKGLKKMLVASESLFFGEAKTAPVACRYAGSEIAAALTERNDWLRDRLRQRLSASWGS